MVNRDRPGETIGFSDPVACIGNDGTDAWRAIQVAGGLGGGGQVTDDPTIFRQALMKKQQSQEISSISLRGKPTPGFFWIQVGGGCKTRPRFYKIIKVLYLHRVSLFIEILTFFFCVFCFLHTIGFF